VRRKEALARIFITGSAGGLGRAAAQTLLGGGHEVIVHARSAERLAAVDDLIGRGASAVVGDLADLDQTWAVADQVNRLGRVDVVIHNPASTAAHRLCRSMWSRRTCSLSSLIARSG
jgi:NADP-dependent 3-hydroxy acid dehydrogenase YdfG